ncbi:unnamed protein product, partial [Mesorhabditis spiculigera]
MPPKEDPFAAPADANLFDDNYDPFDVRPVEDIVAAAKAKAEAAKMSSDGQDDDYFGATDRRSNLSTPTQEGGSPISARPTGFEDEFKCEAYDVYGKIHTVKLQYVQYKERVGIRPGQISRLVEGHVTKYGLPLEHSAQCNVLLKFGSLNADELQSFVNTIEDVLFKCPAKRDTKPQYKQDEVQIHCYDEYTAHVDKLGIVSDQRARVRMFCLAFVSGSPFLEIGLNDRRRQGKEIVRRKDILPMYTERWIRFENLEFHNTVEQPAFESEQVIRLQPPDGCFFEIMRFRVRPPKNREKALTVKCIMKIAGSKVEIRMEAMAAAQVERFPIPEAWIYIFREERHWGVGSVHSKKLRPGKVKNLKDRLLGAVQQNESNLIEVEIDYIQCADLDVDAVANSEANPEDTIAIPEMHRPAMHPTDVADMHEGYRINLPEAQFKRDDSSSDEDEAKTQFPTIKIDMSNYGY